MIVMDNKEIQPIEELYDRLDGYVRGHYVQDWEFEDAMRQYIHKNFRVAINEHIEVEDGTPEC